MRRRIPFALPVAILAALAISSHGQEVLKPFRLGPPTEPEPEIPKAVPLKPFRPSEPAPPPGDEEIPKAVPVKKPTPTPAPAIPIVPNPPLAPSSAPTPRPPRTMTDAVRPPTAEMPDPADIVVGRTAPTTADQVQLQYADNYYSKKMWRDAAAEYERYLDQFRKAPAADRQAVYYRLGECYRQTGAVNNAKANYEALLTNFSGGEFLGYAAYRLASIQYEEKDYRSALQSYRRASVRLTQPVLMHASRFFVGRCMEALGQKNEARQQYDELSKIVENNPFRDASRLSTGRLFADATQREQALKWLQPLAAETTNPQIKAEALARTGLLLADLARPNEASKVFDAALALPEIGVWKDELLAAKFRILYDQKDYKGVLARYQSSGASLQKIENKLNVLVTVANSQRELGMREEALATYAQIGQDFPATQQARDAAYARLVMMYDAGDDRLLNEVNVFLADNPAAPQVDRVSLMKAEAVFKAGDFEHAAPIYEEVIGRTKALPGGYKGEATFKLGWCWVQLGHLDKAVETFTAFLREFPTHVKVPTALAQRGSAQMQLRQYSAAQKDFAELVARHPKAKEREYGLENLALIHGQLGDQARMAETFEMLLAEFPQTAARPKAHYWIGRTAFEMKNYKKAVPHLDQARKLDKEQFFERSSLALMACLYNIEDVDATEKEIEFYKKNGGKAATPSDVIRWLGQKSYERGQYYRAEKFLPELVLRKEAVGEDYLLLARSRVKMSKFKDAVDSFDHYLASTKDPVPRVAGMIEKADAQIGLKDWAGADRTVKEGLSLATEGRYNGELRLRAGDVEAGRGDPKKALQIFEAIPVTLDDNDVSPRALEREMELHAKLGNTAEAKRVENQLRSKYPEYMQKKRAPIP
jgi:TolA-binding protein